MTGAAKAALVVITVGGDIGCSQYSEGTKMVCALCVTRTWHGSVMPSEIPDRCLYLDGNDRPNDTVGSCLYCVHLNIVYKCTCTVTTGVHGIMQHQPLPVE